MKQFPDLSYWSGKTNISRIKALGAPLVILRASWGIYPDTLFAGFRAEAEAIGLPWMAYHYYDFRWSYQENAQAFLDAMAGDYGQGWPILDYEQDPGEYIYKRARTVGIGEAPEEALDVMPMTRVLLGMPKQPAHYLTQGLRYRLAPSEVQAAAWNWLDLVEKATQKSSWIYTGYYYWTYWMTNAQQWLKSKLWQAWYTENEADVRIPLPWTVKTAWQYTGNGDGVYWGQTGKSADLSYDTSGFSEHLGETHPPHVCKVCGLVWNDTPTPPAPPPSNQYRITTGHNPNVHTADNSTSPVTGLLLAGAVVIVEKFNAIQTYAYISATPTSAAGWIYTGNPVMSWLTKL